jgi:hypothetical protein
LWFSKGAGFDLVVAVAGAGFDLTVGVEDAKRDARDNFFRSDRKSEIGAFGGQKTYSSALITFARRSGGAS